MSIKLEITDSKQARVFDIKQLNEFTVFPEINFSDLTALDIDLDALGTVNSVGVRVWISWLSKFPQSYKFTISNAPRSFLDLATIVRGLVPVSSKFRSIRAPFYCGSCAETTLTLPIEDLSKTKDSQKCPVCQKSVEIDLSSRTLIMLQENWKIIL